VEQVLRRHLGELDAEGFYSPERRAAKVQASLSDLNAALVPSGVRALQLFVLRYVYDERYQTVIEQRKIQDQTFFKNQAEAEMARAAAERDRVVAVGEATVKVELSRGDAQQREVDATAQTYVRTQHAQGDLAVHLAEAEGTSLENEAYRGAGAENLVGLKMADVLRGTKVIIVPSDGDTGMNPLDMRDALKKFGVQHAP
jgi:regulator of protease activity HflC (stomatin/prohibitin superfamily)